jgi:hypothetical protein
VGVHVCRHGVPVRDGEVGRAATTEALAWYQGLAAALAHWRPHLEESGRLTVAPSARRWRSTMAVMKACGGDAM